jgi:hypothetical protein
MNRGKRRKDGQREEEEIRDRGKREMTDRGNDGQREEEEMMDRGKRKMDGQREEEEGWT